MDLNLTQPYEPTLRRQIAKTHKGMAFWADTSEQGGVCRSCVHWRSMGYWAKSNKRGPVLKPGLCREYKRMTGLSIPGPGTIPHSTKACKYFEENSNPPALTDPKLSRG